MSARVRNKETQVRLAIDGDDQGGSFLKITQWEVSPQVERTKTSFTGEDRPDGDLNHGGYDFSFTIQELDSKAVALLSLIDANEEAHLPPPNVVLTVYTLYRESGAGDATELFTEIVMSCESRGGSGSDYIESKWGGFARYRKLL